VPDGDAAELGVVVALVEAADEGELSEAVLVLPHAHSKTIATSALKRIRGNIAGRRCVFAYSPPWPAS